MSTPAPPPPSGDPTATVVGGGPAGLMAAEVLATAGVAVTLFERMPSVGRKFLLAGRGGLNITHSEPLDALLPRYGSATPTLEPAVRSFDPASLRAWCAGLEQETFVGTSGRVFPVGLRATPLLRAWLRRLDELGVDIRLRQEWTGWAGDGTLTFTSTSTDVMTSTSLTTSRPTVTVLALGGASWPRVGSNGAWVRTLAEADVDVVALRPANCGFVVPWSPTFSERFAGTPLKNVRITHGDQSIRGEAMITATGIEGGAVYALSRALRQRIDDAGSATLTIDLQPDLSPDALALRLERRRPKDSRSTTLRRAGGLSAVAIGLLREATGNDLPTAAAAQAALIKALPLTVVAPQPLDKAISTAGGIALDEIDDTFMLRRRPGTFIAGEMLDWEAPTGGYLLQATLSTAVAAATGAVAWIGARRP